MREFSHINNKGRRYTKVNGLGPMKNKPKKKDRKETLALRPCHPDLKPAIDSLIATRFTDALLSRISVDSASAALALEGGGARVDDCDAETSDNEN